MEAIRRNLRHSIFPVSMVFIIITIMPGFRTQARAGEGAAFLGGMVAGHLVGGAVRRSRIRTAAAVETAKQPKTQTVYVQEPDTVTTSQPAPTAEMTPEQKLQQLDKLAAGGYITPEEYKVKKKAILDSL